MPHYRIKKFNIRDRDVWVVYDTQNGRTIATYLNESGAISLTHTLNVADLGSSIVAFDAEP
jgi:hypothetical protein